MNISYRNFQAVEDLEIQRKLFIEATSILKWAWKPNRSQEKYFHLKNFDPKTKMFAFNGTEPIGYASCVKWEKETPIGYPWVKKGYEGEVQHHLFDSIYNYAKEHLNSKHFLQRFRKEWRDQLKFFEEKGFEHTRTYPIYVYKLKKPDSDLKSTKYRFKVFNEVPVKDLKIITQMDKEFQTETEKDIIQYFGTDLDLDCLIVAYYNTRPVAITGMASRADLKYSEIMLLSVHNEFLEILPFLIESTIETLHNRKYEYCSITLSKEDIKADLFKEKGFNYVSESIYYEKTLN
jgi:hypothetical protein